MKRKSRTKIVKRVNALLIALVMILTSVQIPAQGALRQDYGSITVADIILAWYNASGVAIGNTNIANAIISAYDSITLNDLIEEGVIVSTIPNSSIEDIKQMLGYGNMSVPVLNINKGKLRTFLGDIPANNVAYDALTAMFNFGTTDIMEGVFAGLASIIGQVANIGKISYNVVRDVVEDIGSNPLWTSVRDAYNHFVDTTYFQDLLKDGEGSGSDPVTGGLFEFHDSVFSEEDVIINSVPLPQSDYGVVIYRNNVTNDIISVWTIDRGYLSYFYKESNSDYTEYGVRCNGYEGLLHLYRSTSYRVENNKLRVTGQSAYITLNANSNIEQRDHTGWDNRSIYGNVYIGNVNTNVVEYANSVYNGYTPDNPDANGVTDYINKEVGNITESNYSILSPNINVGEYMYLADGATYIETLNQITNNTDNGDYSQNGDVITNYNNTYIQNTIQETRPTVGPVESPIPAQPFISPRPTQAPEDYEAVIHQGGIPETIKQKFPFCIPWDLAAVLQNLWAPEARAPYIHWDATFGSWGKLGEVDLDFSIFNDAARIFRATTLILWIMGLVVITRNIIGG